MKRWALVFIFLPFAGPAWGEEFVFTASGTKSVFVHDPAHHMTLSKDCEKGAGKFQCQAYSALSKSSLRGVVPKGGASPGALICGLKLGGDVVIGKDSAQNENSFCRFDDGSMVSCGSLTYYGRKNDLKKIKSQP